MGTTDASRGTAPSSTGAVPTAVPAPSPSAGTPPPATLEEIAARIGEVRAELAAWFGGAPLNPLFRRAPGQWAPIDDLRHLVRVNAALAKGLGYPLVVLRVRFGRPQRRAWSYERLAVLYDALLTTGVKSPPPYEPGSGVVADREAYRERVLGRWHSVNEELLGRVARLTERGADRGGLPHPGLGVLSIREMLFFTIHHDLHHLAVAKRRLSEAEGQPPSPRRGTS